MHLSTQADEISWRFSSNKVYSTSSPYDIQFSCSIADFQWSQLWQAKAENKCNFFCWLALQNKLWTTDRILKHGGQANPTCQLCCTQPESVIHMLSECLYLISVWRFAKKNIGMAGAGASGDDQMKTRLQKMIYIVWNIWKERCRRVFDLRAMAANLIQSSIRTDVQQWRIAWRS
jgi:hypothetical protein